MVIIGVRSPLIVELEESCFRAQVTVEAAVSFSPIVRMIDKSRVVDAAAFQIGLYKDYFLPCAFGPSRRRELAQEGISRGLRLAPALIDPTAILAQSSRLGRAVYINAGAIIGALSIIRECALINRSASVGHHCVIGDYTSIGPGVTIASNVIIEEDVVVGAGAVIVPDIHVGRGAVIAAGAVVSRDIPVGALVVGGRGSIVPDGARRTSLTRGTEE